MKGLVGTGWSRGRSRASDLEASGFADCLEEESLEQWVARPLVRGGVRAPGHADKDRVDDLGCGC